MNKKIIFLISIFTFLFLFKFNVVNASEQTTCFYEIKKDKVYVRVVKTKTTGLLGQDKEYYDLYLISKYSSNLDGYGEPLNGNSRSNHKAYSEGMFIDELCNGASLFYGGEALTTGGAEIYHLSFDKNNNKFRDAIIKGGKIREAKFVSETEYGNRNIEIVADRNQVGTTNCFYEIEKNAKYLRIVFTAAVLPDAYLITKDTSAWGTAVNIIVPNLDSHYNLCSGIDAYIQPSINYNFSFKTKLGYKKSPFISWFDYDDEWWYKSSPLSEKYDPNYNVDIPGVSESIPISPDDFQEEDGTNILVEIYKILLLAVPLLLIAMGTWDFSRATLSSDKDALQKAIKDFQKRVIAGVIVILVPLIVNILLNIAYDAGILKNKPQVWFTKE